MKLDLIILNWFMVRRMTSNNCEKTNCIKVKVFAYAYYSNLVVHKLYLKLKVISLVQTERAIADRKL